MDLFLLFGFVFFALGVSFLCSLLEATLLSTRLATLSELARMGNRGAGLLFELKRRRIDDAISAILVLNTISNTLGATLAGAQAARVFGGWVGVFSAALTLAILVFSEIIPKTLGAVYSRSLAGAVGWLLHLLTRIMAPVLVISRSLTRLLTRGKPIPISRGELAAVISTATQEGAISPEESILFANLLRVNEVRVEDVMTPRTVAFVLPENATIEDLLANGESEAHSRIPIYRDTVDNIVGYVHQRDILQAAAEGTDRSRQLGSFSRRIWFIPEMITVDSALRQFLQRREPIAAVTDEHGGLAGLVTLEDLTETILGTEIVDESDRVADLRQSALELRDRRLERLRRKRQTASGARVDADPGSASTETPFRFR